MSQDLDTEFQTHYHAVVDLIEALAKEQEVLDAHDDLMTEKSVWVERVISASSNEASRRIAARKLSHLQKSLNSIASVIGDLSTFLSDVCLLKQYEQRASHLNQDLAKVRDDLHRMELDESDSLSDTLESQIFKKLLFPACIKSETLSHLRIRVLGCQN